MPEKTIQSELLNEEASWELYTEAIQCVCDMYQHLKLKFGKNHKLTQKCKNILDESLKFVVDYQKKMGGIENDRENY
jgi:hypothetical protein